MTLVVPADRCPLCDSAGARERSSIPAQQLQRLYRRSYGVDTRPDFVGATTIALKECAACGLGYFTPPAAGTPGFYEQFQRFDWYYPKRKPEFELAAEFLRSSASILEIGCGEGYFADYVKGCRYVGLEYTERSRQAARRRGIDARLQSLESYAAEHPLSTDAVCAFQVLEHVRDPRSFINAALACLKPEGLLVFSVPSADAYVGLAVNNLLNFPPHHVTWWSDAALAGLAGRFPLELVKLEHDVLADEHVEAYLYTLFLHGFDRQDRAIGLIDTSPRSRLLHRLARFVVPVLARGMRHTALRPRGHSVTAVFRKLSERTAPALS